MIRPRKFAADTTYSYLPAVVFDSDLLVSHSFKIAGWSIREEAIRKVLTKEFPKLNAKLLDELSTPISHQTLTFTLTL
jgi:hypothetical protein